MKQDPRKASLPSTPQWKRIVNNIIIEFNSRHNEYYDWTVRHCSLVWACYILTKYTTQVYTVVMIHYNVLRTLYYASCTLHKYRKTLRLVNSQKHESNFFRNSSIFFFLCLSDFLFQHVRTYMIVIRFIIIKFSNMWKYWRFQISKVVSLENLFLPSGMRVVAKRYPSGDVFRYLCKTR